jgi:carbonic anhydrase
LSKQNSLSRRTFIRFSGLAVASAGLAACQPVTLDGPTRPAPTPVPPVTNGEEALQRLLAGNQRYALNKSIPMNESEQRRIEVAAGQHPFAMIFSCVDSRVPPELVFDEGLGDLFVIRTAGQVIDNAVLGSLEFGVAELGIPLLMVLGHEKCGAVKATLEAVEAEATAPAEINFLVEAIRPAIEMSEELEGDHLANAVHVNVELVVEQLNQSAILSDAVAQGALQIIGAIYDLDTGLVEMVVS